jgi:DNA-binding NtrC family response regulator
LILVADDDAVARRLLDHHLREAGFETVLAADGADAIDKLGPNIALALVDLQMPKADGMQCLRIAQERFPELPVVMISQTSEIKTAVHAMKQGAFEYITKPIEPDELLAHVQAALRSAGLAKENLQLRQAMASPMPPAEAVGVSPAARRLAELTAKVAPLDATVLLTGESGVGKSTLARRIHLLGPRAAEPFVAVSCAALPRDLIEAELFGHVKGAFTGAVADRPGRAEMADGGTLFLDEVGDLPLELQPKLLAFLQDHVVQRIGDAKDRTIDVRVVAATHQDLAGKCRQGTFREDLFFRLNVLPIHVPPLRDRPEDVLALSDELLRKIAKSRGGRNLSLTPEARSALAAYHWPGNIRELQNVLERASAFASGSVITPVDLDLSPATAPRESAGPSGLAGLTLEEIERRAIVETLRACKGNKKAAAKSLGIDEKSIYNKMKRLGLSDPS